MRLPRNSSSSWIALGTAVAAGVSFILQAGLSLSLSDGDYGLISSAIIIAFAVSVFSSMGAQDTTLHLVKAEMLSPDIVSGSYWRLWLYHNGPMITLSASAAVILGSIAYITFFVTTFAALISAYALSIALKQSKNDFRGVSHLMVGLELAKLVSFACVLSLRLEIGYIYILLGFFFLILTALFFGRKVLRSLRLAGLVGYKRLLLLGLPYAFAGFLFMMYYRVSVMVLSYSNQADAAGSVAVVYLFLNAILILPTTYSQRFLQGRWHSIGADKLARHDELRRQVILVLYFSIPVAVAWLTAFGPLVGKIYPGRYDDAYALGNLFSIVIILRCLCIPLQGACSIASLRWQKLACVCIATVSTASVALGLAPTLGFTAGLVAAVCAELVFAGGLSFTLWRHSMKKDDLPN